MSDILELSNETTMLKNEIDQLYHKNYLLHNTMKTLLLASEKTSNQISKLRNIIDNQQIKIHSLEDIIDNLEAENKIYKSKHSEDLVNHIDKLKADIAKQTSIIDTQKQTIAMLEAKVHQFHMMLG